MTNHAGGGKAVEGREETEIRTRHDAWWMAWRWRFQSRTGSLPTSATVTIRVAILLSICLIGSSFAWSHSDFFSHVSLHWPLFTIRSSAQMSEFHDLFVQLGSNASIAHHLYQITREPHVAGTPENFKTADYVLSAFRKYGLRAHHREYQVLLTYPISGSLSLNLPDGSVTHFALKEAAVEGDPYSRSAKIIPPFHGYSPSGTAVAAAVYANYGRVEDFDLLKTIGIDVRGAIVIARYGKIYRGDIVLNAATEGAVAVLIYSDPMDYAANGTQGYYPDSQWLPPSGVQRGTTYEGQGDPLTPGWPSNPYAERLSVNDTATLLPRIPSIPISAEDALPILMSLTGPVAPEIWHGALNISAYHIGPGPATVNFSYSANETITTIRNAFAVIRGFQEPDRYVILGNHRDAWTFGAVDPNSGTSALLEIAQRFGKLLKSGWKPRRTIIMCSWDAEEYGLVGSTEWVEENVDLLSSRAVVYLNADSAVSGPGFYPAATPQIDNLLKKIMRKVKDPEHQESSIYDAWVKLQTESVPSIGRLGGSGSDYAPFLHHVGVPAVDLSFGNGYPMYHSAYDDFIWMQKFCDPFFQKHVAVASVWGLLAMKLADEQIIPFDYHSYATELQRYAKSLDGQLAAGKAPQDVTVTPIHHAIADLFEAALQIRHEAKVLKGFGSETKALTYLLPQFRALNDRLFLTERAFLDAEGLPGSSWHKHLIYAPSTSNEYGSTSFPGVVDTLEAAIVTNNIESWLAVQHEIWRVARVINRAALVLQGELT